MQPLPLRLLSRLKEALHSTYAKWSGNPTITITHPIEEGSPFFAERLAPAAEGEEGATVSKVDGVAHLSCSLVASDQHGTPISEVQQYSARVGFQEMILGPYLEADRIDAPSSCCCGGPCGCCGGKGRPRAEELHPQILHHTKFDDQMNFGVPTDEELARGKRHWCETPPRSLAVGLSMTMARADPGACGSQVLPLAAAPARGCCQPPAPLRIGRGHHAQAPHEQQRHLLSHRAARGGRSRRGVRRRRV